MSQNLSDLPDVSTLSYEQARDELVEVVRQLEAGSTSLEDALTLWERGEALAARCQSWLDNARARLDAARAPADGQTSPPADQRGTAAARPDHDPAAEREAALDDAAAALPEEESA
ncbi:exodeoxyribonuclease VII small subunit [Georgenia sp. EYE_87]|uniref:exodeoxyribonuclease VII small subunit n=1 Tax=Georgenia sp. EYE_87 TaxID=2853448 RepID=UPI0035A85051|nr:exodeoxyribonuclease VII small subunit [Georgenia sp. EYE_87]